MIIGIDPGLSGAIAYYDAVNMSLQEVHDIPTFTLERNGKKKREIDCARLVNILCDLSGEVWLEQVNSMPGQGVSSVFAFGQVFGIIKGIVATLRYPLNLVTPQVWKKALKVPAAKDGSRARASQLMPHDAEVWQRVKDDGRAEAAMIAYYGARQKELW